MSKAIPPPRDWGPWRLDTRTWVLYPVRPYRYEVDLEQCLTSAQVLDRVMQIAAKTWADDELIGGLIRALGDVLRPQVNLCSFGASRRIGRGRVREQARDAQDERDEGFRAVLVEDHLHCLAQVGDGLLGGLAPPAALAALLARAIEFA